MGIESEVEFLREFATHSAFESFDLAIVCLDGNIRGVLAARPIGRPLLTTEVKISKANCLKLWRELEAIGMWDLPSGEFWPVRELVETGSLPGNWLDPVKFRTEDYKTITMHPSLWEVEVRVKDKSHGFLRLSPSDLKDPRYDRVITIIMAAAPQVDEFLTDWYRQQSGQN